MDILGWDYCAEDDAKRGPNNGSSDYDLWELNCCVVRDAYWRGDTALWDRVFAHWDEMLSH